MLALSALTTKIIVAGTIAAAAGGGMIAVSAGQGATATVERVIDGDTFDATLDGRPGVRIRLLNVDTPETKDPDAPVECLGPEASARLAQLLPVGSEVSLEGDDEALDRYDRTLAGVTNADDEFVNVALAREGLGLPMLVGGNDRFYDDVVEANAQARAARVGLYAATVTCTVPGRVEEVERAAAAVPVFAATPERWDAVAGAAESVTGRAATLLAIFDGPRAGAVWNAFTRVEQDAFRARVAAVRDRSTSSAGSSRSTAVTMRTAAAARERAAEQVRRDAEARERAEVRAAAQAQVEADLAESRRQAARAASSSSASSSRAPSDDSSSSSSGRSSGSRASSGSDGYTGPRCYAPGGRTYRPC